MRARRLSILPMALGLLLPPAATWAEHAIHFVGPKVLHLQAWHTPSGPDEVRYEEVVVDPRGVETAVLSGPSAVTSVRIDCDSSEGAWVFRSTLETVDREGNHHVSESEAVESVAGITSGTLLFDETVGEPDNEYAGGTVQVPSGLQLKLVGTWNGGGFITTGGRIEATEGIYSAVYLSAKEGGHIAVAPGSHFFQGGLTASDQGSVVVMSGAFVSGASFRFNPGASFDPGNASGLTGNTFTYHEPTLTGSGALRAATGRVVLDSGSEGATVTGEGYDLVVQTSPIHFKIANSAVTILADANINEGLENCSVTVGAAVIPSAFTGTVHLNGLQLSSLGIWGAEDCSVTGCEIGGSTTICMGKPVLSGSVFVGTCNILGGSGAELSDNAFHGTLTFSGWGPGLARPTIESSDFLSPVAIQYRPNILFPAEPPVGSIFIGSAYYGSVRGPSLQYGGGFLGQGSGHQGGWVSIEDPFSPVNRTNYFVLAEPLITRATRRDPRHYDPRYWVAGWASGQGVLDWSGDRRLGALYKQVPTLLSFDVKSSGRVVPCPSLVLKLDGSTVIQPATQPPTLSRDLNDFNKTRVRIGGTTVNFRLPETTESAVEFALILEGNDDVPLAQGRLEFVDHPWSRPLRVAVIPIGVEYNFSSVAPPAAAPASRFLKYVLPSMFPIPQGRLQADLKPAEWMETNLGLLSNLPGIAALAGKLSLWYVDILADPKYDLVVAVMPPGSIRILSAEIDYFLHLTQPASGVNYGYGENFWLSTPRVLFVDAEAPMAALHELGHAAGLYRDTEQYDMPEYIATEGRPLRGFSSAALDDQLGNILSGFPPSGILHFADTNMTWYGKEYAWIDVMGLPETEVWPSVATYNSVLQFFNGLLIHPASAPTTDGAIPDATFSADPAPAMDIGSVAKSRPAPMDITGPAITLAGIAVEPKGQNPELLATHNTAMETSMLPVPVPELAPASNWFQYGIVRFYDAAGLLLMESDFDLPRAWNESTWWTGSLPLPPGCARYSLFGHSSGKDSLKTTWQKAGNLAVQIDRTLLPSPLGPTLDLRWAITADAQPPESHLTSQLLVSTNNGATWDYLGKATEGFYRSLATEAFPKTDTLALRVVASDGFTSSQDTVTGLRVGDRSPTLQVANPRPGDVALTHTVWALQAHAWDSEDGDLRVTWRSDRDGTLTSPVVLTPGLHRLTCSATDSAAHLVQTNLDVSVVSNPTSTDLAIESLTLLGRNHEIRQNWSMASGAILAGETNVLDCRIRNSGILTTGLVSVVISQPDGRDLELTPVEVAFEPLVYHRITFPFVPALHGVYRLTVLVEPQAWPDRHPADNVRSISTFTYVPSLLVNSGSVRQEFVFLSSRYDFPYPPPAGIVIPTTVSESFEFYNGGYVPLTISSAVLTCGPEFYGADHFRIFPAAQFPVTLQPGQDVRVHLQFYGKTLLPESTALRVRCNDPRRPDFEIPVHGWIHPPDNNQWRDEDSDGLPSFLEIVIGLNPALADTDGDGIVDGQEDWNANGIRDHSETGALNPDTDGDGLLDGEEDRNGNGGHDGHETSPLLADSDGDGVSDADEARCRTGALNAADLLQLGRPFAAASQIHFEWAGRAGVTYEIHRSEDLHDWHLAPSGVAEDQQSRRTARVDGRLRYQAPLSAGPAFYRVNGGSL